MGCPPPGSQSSVGGWEEGSLQFRGQEPKVGRGERQDPKTSNLLRLFWAGNCYRLRVPAGQTAGHSPPRGSPGRTKGEERSVHPGGLEKHPRYRSHARPPRGDPAAAHTRAHALPQLPADTCRRPRYRTARSGAPSRFPEGTMRSGSALARGAGLGAQRVTRGYLR